MREFRSYQRNAAALTFLFTKGEDHPAVPSLCNGRTASKPAKLPRAPAIDPLWQEQPETGESSAKLRGSSAPKKKPEPSSGVGEVGAFSQHAPTVRGKLTVPTLQTTAPAAWISPSR